MAVWSTGYIRCVFLMRLGRENVFVTCSQTCFSRIMLPEVRGLCGSGPVASDSPSCSVEQRSFPSGVHVLNFTVITASITVLLLSLLVATEQFSVNLCTGFMTF